MDMIAKQIFQKFMEILLIFTVIACAEIKIQINNQIPVFLAISPFLSDRVTKYAFYYVNIFDTGLYTLQESSMT